MYKLEAGLGLAYFKPCVHKLVPKECNQARGVISSHTVSPSMLGKLPWLYLSSRWNMLSKFEIYIILFSFCDLPFFCLSIFIFPT